MPKYFTLAAGEQHLRYPGNGAIVQMSAYQETCKKAHASPKDLSEFDLAILESFDGLAAAERAASARALARNPQPPAPSPAAPVAPDVLTRRLVAATKSLRAVVASSGRDEDFDRGALETRLHAERAQRTIEPGQYDAIKFVVAQAQLAADPAQLTDGDLEQLAVVDVGLADEARAARAGYVKADKADEADDALACWPVSVAALIEVVKYHRRQLELFAASIARLSRETAVRVDRIEERIGTPMDDASKLATAADEISALKSRIAQLEQRQHLHYEGVWAGDKIYTPGALVTDKGALWVAHMPIAKSRPGGLLESSRGWQMIAKSGT